MTMTMLHPKNDAIIDNLPSLPNSDQDHWIDYPISLITSNDHLHRVLRRSNLIRLEISMEDMRGKGPDRSRRYHRRGLGIQ
jgi:hypothetical protein